VAEFEALCYPGTLSQLEKTCLAPSKVRHWLNAVLHWCSVFPVIFLSICYFVSVCCALALVALLQFLVLALACANCKCANNCLGVLNLAQFFH
jgi:hypothetical protein